ncbi:hypothetical protein ABZP36_028581 [Zizania latifolia]
MSRTRQILARATAVSSPLRHPRAPPRSSSLPWEEQPRKGPPPLELRLFDTLTKTGRRAEPFRPRVEGKVCMYVCGVTPYLRYLGHGVEYVRNFTDIDDKIMDNGKAYTIEGDVYLSVDNFPDYLSLSGRKLDHNLPVPGSRLCIMDGDSAKEGEEAVSLCSEHKLENLVPADDQKLIDENHSKFVEKMPNDLHTMAALDHLMVLLRAINNNLSEVAAKTRTDEEIATEEAAAVAETTGRLCPGSGCPAERSYG